jgi:glycerol-3-phosphate O-acyltransferase/dihydroxyacetone phosphate acyltransferase
MNAPCPELQYKDYQDRLAHWGITDDRIMNPLSRRMIAMRMVIRLSWSVCLFTIAFPGLLLWTPVFATTYVAVRNFKKKGPITDTWDEIAEYKVVYGLFSGLSVWAACILLTLPSAAITTFLVPALMWMTLRWMEDTVSAFRAFVTLARLLCVGKKTLQEMRTTRRDLHVRLMNLAVGTLSLPDDPDKFFVESGGKQKGRVRSKWDSGAKYFSVRRRRKRDWTETLRLYDQVDYPEL